jgi:hypothetical protein
MENGGGSGATDEISIAGRNKIEINLQPERQRHDIGMAWARRSMMSRWK